MLARTALKPIRTAPAPVKRLKRDRQQAIREKIVNICRVVEPTPFAAEGPCRAGIRSSLCLQGWRWSDADAVAAQIVKSALGIVGAQRPTWKEGQPEWTQDGALPIERERCLRCRKPLPEGHYKFCCKVCSNGYHMDRNNAHIAAERFAARLALKASKDSRK